MVSPSARNLLIICSDEHRRDALGCMGHAQVKTPHLDALAGRGTIFANAYTPSPMCVPARAAMAAGQPVHRIGRWDSAAPYAGRPGSWMHHLRQAGVEVVSIGKLHFRSGDDDNGFSEERLPMHVAGGIGWTLGPLRNPPPDYAATEELARDVGTGETSYTAYDRAITEDAVRWLSEERRLTHPWAGFVSLVSPHYPLTAPAEFANLYDPAAMDAPLAYAEGARPSHPEIQNIARFYDYDRHFDAARVSAARAAYFGLVSFMDDCVGRILCALEASGQAKDTLVVYVSDHGEMLGDHGLWTKQVMYEASAGVPMIAVGPGMPQGRRVTTATSLLDVASTALDALGVEGSDVFCGRSLIDIAGADDDPDRTIFSEYHDGGSTTGTFMIRWGDWKYVHYVGLSPQLFHLGRDPDELCDLAGEASAETRAALLEGEARLRAICDPEHVNRACFADQKARVEALGGAEKCRTAYVFSHTPAPGETCDPPDRG